MINASEAKAISTPVLSKNDLHRYMEAISEKIQSTAASGMKGFSHNIPSGLSYESERLIVKALKKAGYRVKVNDVPGIIGDRILVLAKRTIVVRW